MTHADIQQQGNDAFAELEYAVIELSKTADIHERVQHARIIRDLAVAISFIQGLR